MAGMAEPEESTGVRLELEEGYRFRVDFESILEPFVMDEPSPLGEGAGPKASEVLAAAVGNCLSASLLYCLRRAHIEVTGLRSEVVVTPERNSAGRLRIASLHVVIAPELRSGDVARSRRCVELFQNFCVVSESVREGIDITVSVDPSAPPPTKDRTDSDS